MKKLLKGCLAIAMVLVVSLTFVGCKKKISATSVDTSKVKVINGVSTNGGATVVHDGYLYFINGTRTNDGNVPKDNKRSAVYRVSYNAETGEVGTNYEKVVNDLVGFENGSLYFFGDFMYYTSPSTEVNYKGDTLYYKTKFKRYDLVNKKSYEIYTTQQNSSEEKMSYAYYVVGDILNLVVYESTSSTIKSLKIDTEVKENYTIENVKSCIMSENNGTCVTSGKTVDANSFIFYTVAHTEEDRVQTGVKVFRVSPTTNNSYLIGDNGEDISLLSIRNGKLVYSSGKRIYAQSIAGTNSDSISTVLENIISYETYENVIFVENADGTISVLYYYSNKDNAIYNVAVANTTNGLNPTNTLIANLNASEAVSLIGLTTLNEVIKEDDETTTDVDETERQKVQYLIYIDTKKVYKLEIAREVSGSMVYSKFAEPIQLSTTEVNTATGIITAEIVNEELFIMANVDGNPYLHQVDLMTKEDGAKKATMVGVKE